jgi:hypothetical protein
MEVILNDGLIEAGDDLIAWHAPGDRFVDDFRHEDRDDGTSAGERRRIGDGFRRGGRPLDVEAEPLDELPEEIVGSLGTTRALTAGWLTRRAQSQD